MWVPKQNDGKKKELGHYEKKGCFATGLTLDTCNSLYLYVVSVIRQVAKVATHHIYGATHYNLIITLSQQLLVNCHGTPL
jgi:hypothetical protein